MAGSRRERRRQRRYSRGVALDWFFFVFAGLAAIWLAFLSFTESFALGWWGILAGIAFWVLLAYLVLPRLHRILTTVYVPDYFLGRTRTSDGLLGDPVNLALMGDGSQIERAMEIAGWTRADPVTFASSWRIVMSTITRRSYDEAPVSPLFLFGRQQDFAYQQEVDGNPAQRHHVRFWRCPDGWLLPGGRRVDWLAAGTFDTSVGLSLFTLQITHKIDADTDVERDHIVATLTAAEPAIVVDGIRDFSTGYHARNGGGDSIRTDGDLPIVDVRAIQLGADVRGPEDSPQVTAAVSAAEAGAPSTADAARAMDAAVVDGAVMDAAEAPASAANPAPAPDAAPYVSPGAEARATASTPAKRAAYEPASLLLKPTVYDPDMARPTTTVVGAVFVMLRALAGFAWLAGLALAWPTLMTDSESLLGDLDLTDDVARFTLGVVLVGGAVVLLFDASLGVFILRGHNVPRLLVMSISVLSISSAFGSWWAQGQEIHVFGTLPAVAFDILLLLALSSRSAAAYARRAQPRPTDAGDAAR